VVEGKGGEARGGESFGYKCENTGKTMNEWIDTQLTQD